MCSIMCYCNVSGGTGKVIEGLKATVSSNPVDKNIFRVPDGIIGFQRPLTTGYNPEDMQPFELDGDFSVCSGKIYGFRKLREQLIDMGYIFRSDNDCEILLPLYREYDTDMFAMLDAEFACVIYDSVIRQFVAARDPKGIRPLYYGTSDDGTIVFASEPKSLVKICPKITPFPPGHYYKGGKIISYCDTNIE